MASYWDWLANPSGMVKEKFFGTYDKILPQSAYVAPEQRYQEQAEDQLGRLYDISRGYTEDPSVQRMKQQFALAGQQAYGEAISAPIKSAATKARMARGAKQAIRQDAPMLLEAQRIESQRAAQEELIRQRMHQQDMEQRRMEFEKQKAVEADIGAKDQMQAAREAQDAASTSAGQVIMQAIASASGKAGPSDRKVKKDIKPGGKRTREFLESLSAKEFKFKDGGGLTIGIMAQDAQKSRDGREMVEDIDDTLHINSVKATGPMLAALSDLHERIKKLER